MLIAPPGVVDVFLFFCKIQFVRVKLPLLVINGAVAKIGDSFAFPPSRVIVLFSFPSNSKLPDVSTLKNTSVKLVLPVVFPRVIVTGLSAIILIGLFTVIVEVAVKSFIIINSVVVI